MEMTHARLSRFINLCGANDLLPLSLYLHECIQKDLINKHFRELTIQGDMRDSETHLIVASRIGCTFAIEFLLSNGAVVEDTDQDQKTALMWACEWGHFDTARMLLDAGANPNARDDMLNTPLMYGISHPEVVKLLVKYGADIEARDNRNLTILVRAIKFDRNELIQILLENGAKPPKEFRDVLIRSTSLDMNEIEKLVEQYTS